MAGPLEQFEIKPIVEWTVGSLDLSFTNSSLWMGITTVALGGYLLIATRRNALRPNRLQASAEYLYGAVSSLVRDNVGQGGRAYFPFFLTLFLFVLGGNLLGLLPGSFTFTSHIAVTFFMAAIVFVTVTLIAIFKHGLKFATYFCPKGVPLWLAPLIIAIELMSYLSRPISLAVRLFANMTVGHVVLKVCAGFVVSLGAISWGLLGTIPLAGLVALTALEVMIAVIQAYVFTILSCIYLHDALHLH